MAKQTVTFSVWMQQVNDALEAVLGMHSDDLMDMPYADMYDAGRTPKQVANKVYKQIINE